MRRFIGWGVNNVPIFDYSCPVCKVTVEVFHPTHEAAKLPAYCPYCTRVNDGDVVMERLPSAPAFYVEGFSAKNGYSSE